MIKSSIWNKATSRPTIPTWFLAPILLGVIPLFIGKELGISSLTIAIAIAGSALMGLLLILRFDELTMAAIVLVHIYVDWYLGLHLFGTLMALVALVYFYLARSPQRPWVQVPFMLLWGLFLLLGIYPSIKGALMLYDLASYYPSDILGACLMFWLGTLVVKNTFTLRRLLQLLTLVGVLIALHTLFQSVTGITLFGTSHYDATLAITSDYQLGTTNVHRATSFFTDPNWNGTFLAMMFFLPLGLFIEARSIVGKLFYLASMLIILPAVLATYSNGAWIGLGAGALVFLFLAGRVRDRVTFFLSILVSFGGLVLLFPAQIGLQLQHSSGNGELPLRIAGWETALRLITAFPFTGVGFGYENYMIRSNPFRVSTQIIPLTHPHNSYLEWGAMGGLPILALFLTLLGLALWLSWSNWRTADMRLRPLLGAGIASIVGFSVNSFSINGWTLAVLSMIGWLILGGLASPLLKKSLIEEKADQSK